MQIQILDQKQSKQQNKGTWQSYIIFIFLLFLVCLIFYPKFKKKKNNKTKYQIKNKQKIINQKQWSQDQKTFNQLQETDKKPLNQLQKIFKYAKLRQSEPTNSKQYKFNIQGLDSSSSSQQQYKDNQHQPTKHIHKPQKTNSGKEHNQKQINGLNIQDIIQKHNNKNIDSNNHKFIGEDIFREKYKYEDNIHLPEKKNKLEFNSKELNQPINQIIVNKNQSQTNIQKVQKKPSLFATLKQQTNKKLEPKIQANTNQQKKDKKQIKLFNVNQGKSNNTSAPKINQIKNQKQKLFTSQQYLQYIISFAKQAKQQGQIQVKLSNLGGARSNLTQLWEFTRGYIQKINPTDQKQMNTFAYKIWDVVINTQIRNSNVKDGIQRIPPNDKTKQVFKNQLNSYILIINLFKVMGYQKIWLIILGKTLSLLDFIWKRKQSISKFKQLQLLQKKYVGTQGSIAPKYLSRLDFLSYFLFGLCSFDPIAIFQQVNERNGQDKLKTYQQILKYNHKWSYRQYWALIDSILSNNNQTYFKLVLYSNLFSSIYVYVRKNKQNSSKYPQFVDLYRLLLQKSQKHFSKIKDNKQLQTLKKQQEFVQGKNGYQFDGDSFYTCIEIVGQRLKQKQKQFKLGINQFQQKATIFYYFKKCP